LAALAALAVFPVVTLAGMDWCGSIASHTPLLNQHLEAMAKVFRVHQGLEVLTLMGIECLTRLEQAFQTLMHEGFL